MNSRWSVPAAALLLAAFAGWAELKLEGWTGFRKPVPDDIDEWTHHGQGPSNNTAANEAGVIGGK